LILEYELHFIYLIEYPFRLNLRAIDNKIPLHLLKINKHRCAKVVDIMSNESEKIGDKFLRKLYEKTINNEVETIDRYEIGKEVGLLDDQTDHIVDELTSDGYIKKIDGTKIYLTDDGIKRAKI